MNFITSSFKEAISLSIPTRNLLFASVNFFISLSKLFIADVKLSYSSVLRSSSVASNGSITLVALLLSLERKRENESKYIVDSLSWE